MTPQLRDAEQAMRGIVGRCQLRLCRIERRRKRRPCRNGSSPGRPDHR